MSTSPTRPTVKLFPERVTLLPMANGVLTEVLRKEHSVQGVYRLDPEDEAAYDSRLRDLSLNLDRDRFTPIPGVWIEVDEGEEDDDGDPLVLLRVGLDPQYGRALAKVAGASGLSELVPEYHIRAMVHGLLGIAGV